MLLNIHTHCICPEGEQTVPSVGLHPWDVTEPLVTNIQEYLFKLAEPLLRSEKDFFLGECGLDRACATDYALQLEAFQAQIALSEQWQRPLILHCVRALDDVIRLHRKTTQPWIWHGFRGKPEQLSQLLREGFYISFGWKYNEASLLACPLHRLFLETDNGPASISPLYEQVASLRGLSVEALSDQTWNNLTKL